MVALRTTHPSPPFAHEVGRELPRDAVPSYAPMLAAHHRAHASELQACIAALPLQPGARVLDMACGNGSYLLWLAERVGAAGLVIGVDIAPAYLREARQRADASPYAPSIHVQTGTIEHLPFDDNTFDLAWCGQSFGSLPDPVDALRELRRVVRPGGIVAVLENDTLHHFIIPWPVEFELAIRQAQLQSLTATEENTAKFFIGRHLSAAFTAAGLADCTIKPHTTIRQAPLSEDEQTYLDWYFQDLRARARPYVSLKELDTFERLLNLRSPHCLIHHPDFFVTYIDLVAWGIK